MKLVKFEIIDLRAKEDGVKYNTSALKFAVNAAQLGLNNKDEEFGYAILREVDESADFYLDPAVRRSENRMTAYVSFMSSMTNMTKDRSEIRFDVSELDQFEKDFLGQAIQHLLGSFLAGMELEHLHWDVENFVLRSERELTDEEKAEEAAAAEEAARQEAEAAKAAEVPAEEPAAE